MRRTPISGLDVSNVQVKEANYAVRNALYINEEYGIQYYDALIVATAEKLHCHEIISEDLNDGQVYRGMMAINPFKSPND